MTERLSLTKKLILMLIVPVAGLLIFSALQTIEKMSVVSSMDRLEELTRLGVSGTALAHELQKERGRTAGFVNSGRKESSELQAQRARSDEALADFRTTANSVKLDGELKRTVDQALQKLTELSNQRSMVSGGTAGLTDSTQWYTDTIASVLDIVNTITHEASTPSIVLHLVALDALSREKEAAGQERALLMAVFTAGRASPQDRRSLANKIGIQQAYAGTFLAHATERAAQAYREKTSASHVDEVKQLRTAVMERGSSTGPAPAAASPNAPAAAKPAKKPGKPKADAPDAAEEPTATDVRQGAGDEQVEGSANDWWRASTARIDGLGEVEDVVKLEVSEAVAELRSGASLALMLFAGLALLSIVGASVLSYYLARGMSRSFTTASETLSKIVSQIGGFVQQQSSSTSQTASSVTETTTTVEEIRKTAETADSSSKEMSSVAQQSRAMSEDALQAVSHGTDAMRHIRSEVESIAQNILELSEKNIQIGEIVQTVNAIAEQSNLLAVNASIEAAKAGEHGKGFSVVASEVKALAQQSKEATDQIRSILSEIQKSSNAAVMITEQGVKRVEEGAALIEELGRTIQNLAGAIQQSSDSASQISLIASQQLAGIEQITEAMRAIGAATSQNVEGARQLEESAVQIRAVSAQILEIVQGQGQARAERRTAA